MVFVVFSDCDDMIEWRWVCWLLHMHEVPPVVSQFDTNGAMT